jgi:hypothetical protein
MGEVFRMHDHGTKIPNDRGKQLFGPSAFQMSPASSVSSQRWVLAKARIGRIYWCLGAPKCEEVEIDLSTVKVT